MKIQLNTDKNIEGSASLELFVSETINNKLKRYSDKITRVEVHLSDQNAHKSGVDDIQSKLEVRIEGINPILSTGKGNTTEKALNDSIEKMKAALDTIIGKMKDK